MQGGIVTVETRAGEVYRGVLDEAEDNMNLILKVGGRDGHGVTGRTCLKWRC